MGLHLVENTKPLFHNELFACKLWISIGPKDLGDGNSMALIEIPENV